MIPLGLLQNGEKGEVLQIASYGKGMGKGILLRLKSIGLYPGKIVEVLNNPGHGPILIKVNETRIAIGRGMAMKIMVRRLP